MGFVYVRTCVRAILTDADSMCGVEDEPQPTHTAKASPGVHTDPVLTQPRLEALIHVYTHTRTHTHVTAHSSLSG